MLKGKCEVQFSWIAETETFILHCSPHAFTVTAYHTRGLKPTSNSCM